MGKEDFVISVVFLNVADLASMNIDKLYIKLSAFTPSFWKKLLVHIFKEIKILLGH